MKPAVKKAKPLLLG